MIILRPHDKVFHEKLPFVRVPGRVRGVGALAAQTIKKIIRPQFLFPRLIITNISAFFLVFGFNKP